MRASLEAIRDEWLAPLVERNGELEREVGAIRERIAWVAFQRDQAVQDKAAAERERDELCAEVERLRAAQDAAIAAQDGPQRAEPAAAAPEAPRSLWGRLRVLFGAEG